VPRINRIGNVINGVEYIAFLRADKKHAYYQFKCRCGKLFTNTHNNVARGNTKSCGCGKLVNIKNSTHGMSTSKIYNVWRGMISRCTRPSHISYKNYGGRGIKVCEQWMQFENFINDMGCPIAKYDIDRIDNEKGYEPTNCRWATRAENTQNTRRQKNG